jgi:16S rRNA (uracil1498-N3)-methyltransferase
MSFHRFYLPPDQCETDEVELRDREAHHAARVLRLGCGDRVVVLDGAGQHLVGEIEDAGRERVRLRVVERRRVPPLPYRLTLLQAVPKGKVMETILQKATELGAARVVPLLSERVVAQVEERDSAAKAARWQQATIEALKQCGTPWLPRVEAPVTPGAFLARKETFDLFLLAALGAGARHPAEYLRRPGSARDTLRSVAIAVGPEGDFTPGEVSAFRAGGAHPITLGPLVLRCDTAAVYCLSVVSYELQAGSAPATRSA